MNAAANPFATSRVERLLEFDPHLIGTSWEVIEQGWAQLGFRACVTGQHGAGKTSFLDAMARRLVGKGRVERLFFNDQKRRISAADRVILDSCEGVFLLVDGDEHLSWWERRELTRASKEAGGCLFARHRKGGHRELLRLRSNPALAGELLERISPEWRRRLDGSLDRRFQGQKGNLRELWLECFDLAAASGK
ncbi:hypothetical protein [Haloferula sp.]|uniref:hypothetical protein n=1 Tax=Haloferula sp. TaxID=2497595 RepID=UPI003C75AC43